MHGHGGPPKNAEAGALSALQNGMDPNGISYVRTVDGGICKDCTVLNTKADVVFPNGTRADISGGIYLHHVIFINMGKYQQPWVSACPGKGSVAPPPPAKTSMSTASFAGGAIDEFTDYFATKEPGKSEGGYQIAGNSSFLMQGELVNYLKTDQEVYIQLEYEWLPGKVGTDTVKSSLSVSGMVIGYLQESTWLTNDSMRPERRNRIQGCKGWKGGQ
jgi:hypothetical protein